VKNQNWGYFITFLEHSQQLRRLVSPLHYFLQKCVFPSSLLFCFRIFQFEQKLRNYLGQAVPFKGLQHAFPNMNYANMIEEKNLKVR